jgi:hypothetical protein
VYQGHFLHLDNVIAYQAPRDFDRLAITKFLYPSYSPDLASYDFWLFGTLKRKLEGFTFVNPVEVMTEVNTILRKILLEEFFLVFDEWKCRLHECIDGRGEYL